MDNITFYGRGVLATEQWLSEQLQELTQALPR